MVTEISCADVVTENGEGNTDYVLESHDTLYSETRFLPLSFDLKINKNTTGKRIHEPAFDPASLEGTCY